MRPGLVCSLALACAAVPLAGQIPGQPQPRPPRVDNPLSRLLEGPPSVLVRPGLGPAMLGFRAGVDGQLWWTGADDEPSRFQLGLDFAGARNGRRVYGRSGVRARYHLAANGHAWLEGAAGMGSGRGPARTFSFAAGAGSEDLRLDVTTSWLSGEPVSDTLPSFPVARATAGPTQRYTDAEVVGRRRIWKLDGQAVAGWRFGEQAGTSSLYQGPDQWVNAQLTLPIRGPIALLLAGGWQPARSDLAQPGGRFARIGAVWNVGASASRTASAEPVAPPAVEVTRVARGFRIRVPVVAARTVDLAGDLSDWKPLPLRRVDSAGGLWELIIDVPAGTYLVNVRVDGGDWIVPPGLPRIDDSLIGAAGLLTLAPT